MKLEPISLVILKDDTTLEDDYNEDIQGQGNHYQLRYLNLGLLRIHTCVNTIFFKLQNNLCEFTTCKHKFEMLFVLKNRFKTLKFLRFLAYKNNYIISHSYY